MSLENILSKGKRILKNLVGSIVVGAGILSLGGIGKSEASIVENLQTAEEPIITKLDYRGDVSSLDQVGTGGSLYDVQSFIALDDWIIDGSLKLARIDENEHNMLLKIWPDNNGIPDIANEIGTTTNELTPRGDTLVDYYLREFEFSAIQVTPGERYWIGLYNPDLNSHSIGVWSVYGNPNPYSDGTSGYKWRNNYPWEIRSDGIDLGFSITFSNISEPEGLELLSLGLLGLLSLIRQRKK